MPDHLTASGWKPLAQRCQLPASRTTRSPSKPNGRKTIPYQQRTASGSHSPPEPPAAQQRARARPSPRATQPAPPAGPLLPPRCSAGDGPCRGRGRAPRPRGAASSPARSALGTMLLGRRCRGTPRAWWSGLVWGWL